jgi:hypothetical protein
MENFTFDGRRADENVILYRHQHPWVLARAGFLDVFLALIVLIFFLALGSSSLSFWVLGIAIAVGFFYTFNKIFLFKNVLFIITDQRIININQSSIFGHKVQETELINIYNLSYSVKGMIRNLLDFGNIELTTEGDVNDRIILKNVPTPHEVFDKLSKARKEAMQISGLDARNRPVAK